ncbi:MAG: archaemetzincin family Zn-dependent metalloprotease [Planctomycetota bacterium]|nr:archaemetzincin family Zn-dependent metalloprotease [Planctomycetota bacterium]MDI6787729.1 archaemetzincin family Zn-dependent metalloprotease [Planctomycetota bacterium]
METIYIRPLGEVDDKIINYLLDMLPPVFNREIKRLNSISIPSESYDIQRRQYLSTELLKTLLRDAITEESKVLGITGADLFIPIFTYIFGEAQLGGRVALVSLARLKPDDTEEPDSYALYQLRALKESVHELGHTFGLKHCSEPGCVMRFANNVIEVDNKDYHFCPSCMDLLNK